MEFVPRKALKVSMEDSFLPPALRPSLCRCRICLKVSRNYRGIFATPLPANPINCPQWVCLAMFQTMQAKSRYKIPDVHLRAYKNGSTFTGLRLYYRDLSNPIGPSFNITIPTTLAEFQDQMNSIIGALLEERENAKRNKDDQALQEGIDGNNQPAQQ